MITLQRDGKRLIRRILKSSRVVLQLMTWRSILLSLGFFFRIVLRLTFLSPHEIVLRLLRPGRLAQAKHSVGYVIGGQTTCRGFRIGEPHDSQLVFRKGSHRRREPIDAAAMRKHWMT